MIALDATAFALLVNPNAAPPVDPATSDPVHKAKERYELLQQSIQDDGDTILIPAPALAEVLVGLGDAAPEVLDRISRSARFKIGNFDTMAAVELAAMTRQALRGGDKKDGATAPWQKVKMDRQIIAIARVHGASRIYSDDNGVFQFAGKIGLPVIRTWELPVPPEPEPSLFDDY